MPQGEHGLHLFIRASLIVIDKNEVSLSYVILNIMSLLTPELVYKLPPQPTELFPQTNKWQSWDLSEL